MTGQEKESVHEALRRIYLDPKDAGSLGGAERLYRRAKELNVAGVTRASVQHFLRNEPSYSLHKQIRRRFARNPTYVQGIDDQWQADLVDMQALSWSNHGIKYLLICIDIFSK